MEIEFKDVLKPLLKNEKKEEVFKPKEIKFMSRDEFFIRRETKQVGAKK